MEIWFFRKKEEREGKREVGKKEERTSELIKIKYYFSLNFFKIWDSLKELGILSHGFIMYIDVIHMTIIERLEVADEWTYMAERVLHFTWNDTVIYLDNSLSYTDICIYQNSVNLYFIFVYFISYKNTSKENYYK